MSYIGQRPVVGRYIKLDQISSGFNGSNTGFSMTAGSQAVFPGTARNLLLSLGGVIQEPDTDFTISGSTLTFTTPPVANTTFFGVIYGDMQATGTPSDGTVLPASIASSGHFKIPQLTVNEDGADVDFRVEGDTETNLLFADASTNRIGIGTSSPSSDLHVVSSGDAVVTITSADGNGAFLDLGDASDPNGGRIHYDSASNLVFDTASTERMRIKSNGNVGIGTSIPTSAGSYTKFLQISDNNSASVAISRSASGSAHTLELGAFSGASLIESTGATSLRFKTNSSERLRIDSSGNVGIGTTSPSNLLHVAGTLECSNIKILGVNSFESSANIFEGKGTNGARLRSALSSATTPSFSNSDDIDTGVFLPGSDVLGFTTGGSERMRIDSSGNVSVGGTTPSTQSAKFQTRGTSQNATRINMHHEGNSSASISANSGLVFASDTSNGTTERMLLDTSGRLLVGTSAYKSNLNNSFDTSGQISQFVHAGDNINGCLSVFAYSGSTSPTTRGCKLQLHRARSSDGSTNTSLSNGDLIGSLEFKGNDGANFTAAARIDVMVDGETGTDDMPGRIQFFTSADGSGVPTERMRIDSSGRVGINDINPDTALVVRGTVAAPHAVSKVTSQSESTTFTIQTVQDSDVRIGTQTNHPLTFYSNALERMRLDTSGRLLAGSTSTANNGRIQGFIAHGSTAGESGITSVDSNDAAAGVGGEISFYGKTNTAGQYNYLGHVRGIKENGTNADTACALTFHTRPTLTAPLERMRIDSSGRVHIGTATNRLGETLHVLGAGILTSSAEDTNMMLFGTFGSSTALIGAFNNIPVVFRQNNTERMRLDSSGNVGIGVTSASAKIHADNSGSGNVAFFKHSGSGVAVTLTLENHRANASTEGEQISFLDFQGNQRGKIINNNSTTTYVTSSDYRLKENQVEISDGIDRVKQLKPYKFSWKNRPGIIVDGFFAHEVENLVKDCVHGIKDKVVTEEDHNKGDYLDKEIGTEIHQMMDHSKLVPLLTAALKSLITRVEALEAA